MGQGRRRVIEWCGGTAVAAALALGILVPAAAAQAQTLVVDVPPRSATPTPTPSATAAPADATVPGTGSDGDATGGNLPPTGGEGLLALGVAGVSIVALGVLARRVAGGRQSSTSARS